MFGWSLFPSLLLSALVLSAPQNPSRRSIQKRNIECNSAYSIPTVSESFTLLAVNIDDDIIQRPLVLGVIPGYQDGVTVVGTANTISKSYATNFTMVNSSIISVPLGGNADVYLSMYVQTTSGLLEFMSKASSATKLPVASYCEEFNTSPHGVEFPFTIDVYGDSNNFSICTTWDGTTDVIVYTPVNGTSLPYNGNTCIPVAVHAIHGFN
ncbi:hypothetical protein K488DRAFT_87648 [Vararia minispora EC-137]|uniref:Uncharacterized protein n=1 Tax=Vararia minispora EC-137 TaxID=1314806 RepID=A0ACB8QFV6_9AGAM|nr:hypothetical protein K488DRAFT_87648 [Vararia minispora EC-137]